MRFISSERFSYDLEMKTRQQDRNNKRTEIVIWLVYRTDTDAHGFWLVIERSGEKNFMPENFQRNQSILCFDVILQHDWPIKQCLLRIRVFFGGKTKSLCFDLFIHWLIKQITNTNRNHFSGSLEKRSIIKFVGNTLLRNPFFTSEHTSLGKFLYFWFYARLVLLTLAREYVTQRRKY